MVETKGLKSYSHLRKLLMLSLTNLILKALQLKNLVER